MASVPAPREQPVTPPQAQSPRRYAAALGGVLLLAIVLRGAALGASALWYDEAMYAILARDFTFKLLTAPYILVEPLFVVPLSWWVQLGDSAAWLRLPSLIAGALAVWVGARIARNAAGDRAALCAALLLACAPVLVYYSRDAKMYAWAILWVLLASRFALEVLRNPGRWQAYAAYGAAGAAFCHTHFAAPLFLSVSGVLLFAALLRSPRQAAAWAAANAVIVLLAVPFILAEQRYGATMRGLIFHASPPGPRDALITFEHIYSAYAVSRPLSLALTACVGALTLLGAIAGRAPAMARAYLLAMGVLPVALLYAISSNAQWSIYIDRYAIACAGPLLVLAGIGAARIPRATLRVAALGVPLLLSAMALRDVYTQQTPDDRARRKGLIPPMEMAEMLELVRANGAPDDLFYHAFWETQPVFRCYMPKSRHLLADYGGQIARGLEATTHPDFQAFYQWRPQDIRDLLAPGTRFWLVLPENTASQGMYSGILDTVRGRAQQLCGGAFGEGDARTAIHLFQVSQDGARPAVEFTSARMEQATGACALTLRDGALHADNSSAETIVLAIEACYADMAFLGNTFEPRLAAKSAWKNQTYLANGTLRSGTLFRVYPGGPKGDTLALEAPLAPGSYAVFLHRTVRGTKYVIPAAQIDVTLGTQTLHAPGTFTDRPGGWEWQRLGVVEHAGTALRIEIGASDPTRQPEGYAVFSHLLLVRAAAAPDGTPTPPRELLRLPCAPKSAAALPLSWPGGLPVAVLSGAAGEVPVSLVGRAAK